MKCETLEVLNVVRGDYTAKFRARSKLDGFRWALVAVYGAAQSEFKPDFLADLVRICGDERLPVLMGVILTSLRGKKKRIMIILMGGGPLCSI